MSKPHKSGAINPEATVGVMSVTDLIADRDALRDVRDHLAKELEDAHDAGESLMRHIGRLQRKCNNAAADSIEQVEKIAQLQKDRNDFKHAWRGEIKARKELLTRHAKMTTARNLLAGKLRDMTLARDTVFEELRAARDGHTVTHAATVNRYDALYQQSLIANMAALVNRKDLSGGECANSAAYMANLAVRKIMDHANGGSDNG